MRFALLVLVLGCEGAISEPPHHPRRERATDKVVCAQQSEFYDGLTVQCENVNDAQDDHHD
jgi:hypothetical protein